MSKVPLLAIATGILFFSASESSACTYGAITPAQGFDQAQAVFTGKGAWAVAVGVVNSQIFPLLGPAKALLVQGIIWLVFGYLVYGLRRRA